MVPLYHQLLKQVATARTLWDTECNLTYRTLAWTRAWPLPTDKKGVVFELVRWTGACQWTPHGVFSGRGPECRAGRVSRYPFHPLFIHTTMFTEPPCCVRHSTWPVHCLLAPTVCLAVFQAPRNAAPAPWARTSVCRKDRCVSKIKQCKCCEKAFEVLLRSEVI